MNCKALSGLGKWEYHLQYAVPSSSLVKPSRGWLAGLIGMQRVIIILNGISPDPVFYWNYLILNVSLLLCKLIMDSLPTSI